LSNAIHLLFNDTSLADDPTRAIGYITNGADYKEKSAILVRKG